jgi:hypothetical protein
MSTYVCELAPVDAEESSDEPLALLAGTARVFVLPGDFVGDEATSVSE